MVVNLGAQPDSLPYLCQRSEYTTVRGGGGCGGPIYNSD